MSALRWGQGNGGGAAWPALFGMSLSFDRFVLPRQLRRPMRVLARLCGGEYEAPRFSAAILSAALLASSGACGAYLGGYTDSIVQGITARTGFAVDQIKVVGNRQTSEIDVLDQLGLDGWTSLIGFDAEAARERIATLPWVEGAAVRKIYPHTLEVRIEERQPVHAAALQPDVEEDQRRPPLGHLRQRGIRVAGRARAVAFVLEDARDHVADVALVIDDENV